MKKIIFIFVASLVLFFSSCGVRDLKIDDYEWKMRYVMHGEDCQVVVDAVGEYDPTHPEAKIVELILVAKAGKITLNDLTNQKIYEGTYTIERTTPAGTDYKVIIEGNEGYATVAMTSYRDGRGVPTLPVNLGTHSIYFYAE